MTKPVLIAVCVVLYLSAATWFASALGRWMAGRDRDE